MSDQLHVSAAPLPVTQVVTSYLALSDQEGQLWFLWIDDSGTPVLTDSRPDGIDLASRQVFSWLLWPDLLGAWWYIWPSAAGTLNFSRERPMGQGTGTIFSTWWSPGRRRWTVSLSAAPALVIDGDSLVQVAALHSIMACPRCNWCGHLDRSNALRDEDGNPLLDRCPKDGTRFYPDIEADEAWT